MSGMLVDDIVIVRDQKESSQLYNKGNYGYPHNGGGIDLDLIEATYLVENNRLDVALDNKSLSFEDIF